jgi:hypothetical protein
VLCSRAERLQVVKTWPLAGHYKSLQTFFYSIIAGKRPAARGAPTVRGGLRPPGRRNKVWPARVRRAKNTVPETFSSIQLLPLRRGQ